MGAQRSIGAGCGGLNGAVTGQVRRHHRGADADRVAVTSPCAAYRYELTHVWRPEGRRVLFVLLNPSTATEQHTDATVARCARRARALGFGAFRVCNIFAFRATRPADMRAAADPVGPANDAAILGGASWADLVLCGWGTHGAYLARGAQVAMRLRAAGHRLHHLGLTHAGHPRHPLYVAHATAPRRWD